METQGWGISVGICLLVGWLVGLSAPPPLPSTESPLPIATPPPTEGDHVIAAVAKTAAWEHVRTFTEERANW